MLTGMEYQNLYQDGLSAEPPAAGPAPAPRRSGRARRMAASAAAAAVLVGSGAAIGIAATGGASAAVNGSAASTASSAGKHARCARLTAGLLGSGHQKAARDVRALCDSAALRLAAVGGLHGQVTFRAKTGTRILAFERGTVETAAGSVLTVRASDGVTWTWDLVAGTVVRRGGHVVAGSTVASGDQVLVVGQVVNGANDARLVRIRSAG
jgi:hypothetical protein